jgi:hypothetical protein
MKKYNESLKKTIYRYRKENGEVFNFSYDDMGNQISIGEVKLNTPVQKML